MASYCSYYKIQTPSHGQQGLARLIPTTGCLSPLTLWPHGSVLLPLNTQNLACASPSARNVPPLPPQGWLLLLLLSLLRGASVTACLKWPPWSSSTVTAVLTAPSSRLEAHRQSLCWFCSLYPHHREQCLVCSKYSNIFA